MLIKTITYTDYNDEERTEKFMFNLSKAELVELQNSELGGLTTVIEKIQESLDNVKTMEYFKKIILLAYGEKSNDGKYFHKSPEMAERFTQTEAYSVLIMELLGDANAAGRFVEALLPKDIEKAPIAEVLS